MSSRIQRLLAPFAAFVLLTCQGAPVGTSGAAASSAAPGATYAGAYARARFLHCGFGDPSPSQEGRFSVPHREGGAGAIALWRTQSQAPASQVAERRVRAEVDLVPIGEALQGWGGGIMDGGDNIGAVANFYRAGHAYPKPWVVVCALKDVQVLLREAIQDGNETDVATLKRVAAGLDVIVNEAAKAMRLPLKFFGETSPQRPRQASR